MFGMPLQVKRFDMSQRLGFPQTGRIGNGCVSSEIHEQTVCGDRAFAPIAQCDMNGARRDECAVAEDEFISCSAKFVQMDFDDTRRPFRRLRA